MAEVRIERAQVYEVVEQGYGGQRIVRGAFTTPEEAQQRLWEVLRAEPHLVGCLGCGARTLETVAPAAAPAPLPVVTD